MDDVLPAEFARRASQHALHQQQQLQQQQTQQQQQQQPQAQAPQAAALPGLCTNPCTLLDLAFTARMHGQVRVCVCVCASVWRVCGGRGMKHACLLARMAMLRACALWLIVFELRLLLTVRLALSTYRSSPATRVPAALSAGLPPLGRPAG